MEFELKTSFAKNLPLVKAVQEDIVKVILNILNNAFEAVVEKSLQSAIGSQQTLDFKPSIHLITSSVSFRDTDYITIKIKDNGNGIPKNTTEKIFEPFFTTKPTGAGTGLGLSISYDIIKAHGGEIKVDSKENEFTEFIISIPV